MMKILSARQMQGIDRITTERYGIPSLQLMENAGAGVVEFLAERFAPLGQHQIAIFCGKGNNGGDGMVAARLLRGHGLLPRVLLFGGPADLKGDAATNYQHLALSGAPEAVCDAAAWERAKAGLRETTLILDALLGTGLSKPLAGFLLDVVRDINTAFPAARCVSVDLPSGLAADSGELIGECVRANACITFTAPKYAHVFPPACEMLGEWRVQEIGTPQEALESDPELFLNLLTPDDLKWLAAPRRMDSHKGTYGHVLVVAGSRGKTGAAVMAGKAALRAGAGLVTVATPRSALPIIAGMSMELMTEALPETNEGTLSLDALRSGTLDRIIEGKSVLAIGPGLSGIPETAECIRELVNRYDLPMVIDADALNAFAGRVQELRAQERVRVLTPHPGEMARLTGESTAEVQKKRIETAREFAASREVCLVLKGARSLTASPDGQVIVNPTGNPGMATAGTGDCLTGTLAGLLAQYPGRAVSEVVAAGVYIHGRAGDLAAEEVGERSLVAGDLLEALPKAFRSMGESRDLRR